MTATTTAEELDRHLVAIWQTLHQARDSSTRFIEGLIAELRDDALPLEQRVASVGRDWWSFLRGGRGIYDFNLSSGLPEEDREANTDFRRSIDQVNQLLERYHPTFGRPPVPGN